MIELVSLVSEGGGRLFLKRSPRRTEPLAYLQQLEQVPLEHFWQDEQVVLQQLLQLFALSAAIAVARAKLATMASMAPVLIRVFILCVFVVMERGIPAPTSDSPQRPKSPELFLKNKRFRLAE
ncbi:MAG: hypothetical protein K8R38_04915 [Verrucomicrobia bacterium]|nr:hypothetical protein [Verrucomicrobiota bacterium]